MTANQALARLCDALDSALEVIHANFACDEVCRASYHADAAVDDICAERDRLLAAICSAPHTPPWYAPPCGPDRCHCWKSCVLGGAA